MKWSKGIVFDLCDINPENISKSYPHDFIRYFDITSVGSGIVSLNDEILLSEAPSRAKRVVRNDDTILATVRPGNRSFYYFKSAFENSIASTGFAILRPKADKTDPRFLYYLVSEPIFTAYLVAHEQGSNYPAVNSDIIGAKQIEIPPLPTQRKIAAILSAYDDLIENNLKRIKLLEEKAFLRYKRKIIENKFEPIAFNKVADYVNGYPFKPNDWKNEGLPIIKIKELKGGVQEDTPRTDGENIPEKYYIKDKDILFAWSASIGAYLWSSGKAILNQHIFNVKPFDQKFHNWLYFSLLEKIPDFINLSNGATMQHIKKSALSMVYLPLPPKSVYEEFEDESEPILNLIICLNKQNVKLREARDILLPRLLSGQIAV